MVMILSSCLWANDSDVDGCVSCQCHGVFMNTITVQDSSYQLSLSYSLQAQSSSTFPSQLEVLTRSQNYNFCSPILNHPTIRLFEFSA
jgi:hypothetical protein